MYLETTDLKEMSKEDIVDFAYRELNISLDTNKSKEWMVQQVYRLSIIEEATGRR